MKIQKIKEAIKDWLLSEWDCLAYTIQQERHKAKQKSQKSNSSAYDYFEQPIPDPMDHYRIDHDLYWGDSSK